MNVARAPLESRENHGIDEANDGAHAGIARELLHGNVFVGVLFVADDLEREALGGLIENALRLLGALQQVADLRSGGDLDLQALAEQQRELVGELQLAGVGHGDDQSRFARFERNEVVAEHQFGGDAAEKLGIDALLAADRRTDSGSARPGAEPARARSASFRTPTMAGLLPVIAIELYPPPPIWSENIGR